ncbi:unnamed protein product, partial [Callosobruchus maculatus]
MAQSACANKVDRNICVTSASQISSQTNRVGMTETQIEKNFSSCQVLETKCGQCGLACSVAPVSEESGSYYCGRCRPEGSPHHPFEEAAKKVLFPCIFGCADVLAWGQAGVHEVVCKSRPVVCPYANCTSVYTFQDLHEHMKACHGAFYQKEPKKHQANIGVLTVCIKVVTKVYIQINAIGSTIKYHLMWNMRKTEISSTPLLYTRKKQLIPVLESPCFVEYSQYKRLEDLVEALQTRLARLVAEFAASYAKLKLRLTIE